MSTAGKEPLHGLLRLAARELARLEDAALSRSGARLRPAQVPVLAALLEASPLTASELCARCEAEPSTMTGLVRTLARLGLVTRDKVVLDQRSYAIALTPRGRAAARVAVRARERAEALVLRALTRGVGEQLHASLAELVGAAQTLAAEAEAQGRPARAPRRR